VARNPQGVIVGAATVEKLQAHRAELITIGVEKELQGRGIGSQLLSGVIEELRKDEFKRVDMHILMDSQYLEFFKKRGFEEFERDYHFCAMKMSI